MDKKSTICVLLLLTGLGIAAAFSSTPTQIQLSQLQLPAQTTGVLLGAASSKTATTAQLLALGANLSISNGVLNAATPASANFIYNETYAVTAAQPTFTLAQSAVANNATVAVYRNGLRQALGIDYTIANGTVTFLATSIGVPGAGETIIFDYQYQ